MRSVTAKMGFCCLLLAAAFLRAGAVVPFTRTCAHVFAVLAGFVVSRLIQPATTLGWCWRTNGHALACSHKCVSRVGICHPCGAFPLSWPGLPRSKFRSTERGAQSGVCVAPGTQMHSSDLVPGGGWPFWASQPHMACCGSNMHSSSSVGDARLLLASLCTVRRACTPRAFQPGSTAARLWASSRGHAMHAMCPLGICLRSIFYGVVCMLLSSFVATCLQWGVYPMC